MSRTIKNEATQMEKYDVTLANIHLTIDAIEKHIEQFVDKTDDEKTYADVNHLVKLSARLNKAYDLIDD